MTEVRKLMDHELRHRLNRLQIHLEMAERALESIGNELGLILGPDDEEGQAAYFEAQRESLAARPTIQERLAPGGDLHGAQATIDLGPLGRQVVTFEEGGARLADGQVIPITEEALGRAYRYTPVSGPDGQPVFSVPADQMGVVAEARPGDPTPPEFHKGVCGRGDFAGVCKYGEDATCPVLTDPEAEIEQRRAEPGAVEITKDAAGVVTIVIGDREVQRGGGLKPMTLPGGTIEGLPVADHYHVFWSLMANAWQAEVDEALAAGAARINIGCHAAPWAGLAQVSDDGE